MSDKLRAAAQAVLETTKTFHVCCGDFNHSKKDLHRDDRHNCPPWRRYNDALAELDDALAEPAIKESLTVRPWVGLTDEEITQGNRESLVDLWAWNSAVSWAEEKLREKNNG